MSIISGYRVRDPWKNIKKNYVQNFRRNHGQSTNYRRHELQFLDEFIEEFPVEEINELFRLFILALLFQKFCQQPFC